MLVFYTIGTSVWRPANGIWCIERYDVTLFEHRPLAPTHVLCTRTTQNNVDEYLFCTTRKYMKRLTKNQILSAGEPTLVFDPYDDDSEATKLSQAPDEKLEPNPVTGDRLFNADVLLPRGSTLARGRVIDRKCDADGIGRSRYAQCIWLTVTHLSCTLQTMWMINCLAQCKQCNRIQTTDYWPLLTCVARCKQCEWSIALHNASNVIELTIIDCYSNCLMQCNVNSPILNDHGPGEMLECCRLCTISHSPWAETSCLS